jgi:hypothetical protein
MVDGMTARRGGTAPSGEPGRGVAKGPNAVQHVVVFDRETFAEVRAKAIRDRTSLSEAIRTLVEWGLQAEGERA